MDQLFAANAAGQNFKFVWVKQYTPSALTVGRWCNTAIYTGSPTAMTYQQGPIQSSSILGAQFIADQAPYMIGTIPTGGPVSPYTKYLTGIEVVQTTSTTAPMWLLLVDLLAYYPNINLNTASAQTFNAVSLPRYTTGAGVQMFMECGATATSTTGQTISATSYTNSAGNIGQAIPIAVQNGTIAAQQGWILHSGVTAANMAPFLPLAQGDVGVQSIQSLTFTGTAGANMVGTLILCKPLAQVPLQQSYFASGRDFVFNTPTLPIIYDGACLAFLVYGCAAVAQYSTFEATLDFTWG